MDVEAAAARGVENRMQGLKVMTELPPAARARCLRVARGMDQLGRLDERTGEVFVDEDALRRLLREVAPGTEARTVAALKRLPGSHLRDVGADAEQIRRIDWATVAQRADDFDGGPDERFLQLGAKPPATMGEVRQAVKRLSPGAPDEAFDPKELHRRVQQLADQLAAAEAADVTAEAVSGSVWDCIVRHLGWWAAICLGITLGAALAAVSLATGGTATVAAAWLIFWILSGFGWGAATVTVIGNCIINPYWP